MTDRFEADYAGLMPFSVAVPWAENRMAAAFRFSAQVPDLGSAGNEQDVGRVGQQPAQGNPAVVRGGSQVAQAAFLRYY
ncbi:hypothetical protein GCM10022406_40220 [Hymenobacter algoricola]|uniref:TonB-dependent receptor n=1 Tax=Hymenobacter algoricola TaxID=486267 RepID=A0ABP7NWF0_9BACT